MSDLKSFLKEAKNSIKDKDYEAAMIHCKDALKIDRKNYQALVMLGKVCIEERRYMDSKKALMLASQIEPENPVAWQGLLNLHERSSDNFSQEEELSVLDHIKQITRDEEKLSDIYFKLAAFHKKWNSPLEAVSVFEQLISISDDDHKIRNIRKSIIEILENSQHTSKELVNQLVRNYEFLLDKTELGENESNFQKYLKILYKDGQLERLVAGAISMSKVFPTAYPLEWIVRVYVETYDKERQCSAVDKVLTEDELFQMISRLLSLVPSSPWGNLGFGLNLLKEGKFNEAKRLLRIGCEGLTSNISIWLLYISILKDHRDVASIEVACKRISSLLDSSPSTFKLPDDFTSIEQLKRHLLLTKMYALYQLGRPKHLKEMIVALKEVDNLDVDLHIMVIKSQLKLGLNEEAVEELKILKKQTGNETSFDLQKIGALVASSVGDKVLAKSTYENILQSNPDDVDSLMGLGKCFFEDEDYPNAVGLLLKAAKIDSLKCSPAFVYLGHYYRLAGNIEKARKCYEKAFSIDRSSEEAGLALSDIYRENGQYEANFTLLVRVTKEGSGDWGWLRLGLHYIAIKEYSQAISALQRALEVNPNDRISFECLGDAYLARGSYIAALKVFTKAVEIDSNEALYARCQIAHINHLVGDYILSISQYEDVLSEDLPSSVTIVALVGLSEVLIARAKKYKEEKLLSNMKNDCMNAVKYLTRSAAENPSMFTVWKLLGDACTLQSSMPASSSFEVPIRLLDSSVENIHETSSVSKDDILQLGAKCYGVGLQIREDSAPLWHDLGMNLFLQGYSHLNISKKAKITVDGDSHWNTEEMKKTFTKRSLAVLRKSLSICASSFNVWNSYGVVAFFNGDLALAQHSFIHSLEIRASVEAWTNLGSVYLQQNDPSLAHEAFCQAQFLNPRFANCWIGQAMVASSVGHYEAFDLYCHTTQLSIHSESCLGFALKVLNMARGGTTDELETAKIQQFLPTVFDSLSFYVREHNSDVAGQIMLGICSEMLCLFHSAHETFSAAAVSSQDDMMVTPEMRNSIYSNLARVCITLNKIPEAISHFSNITEHTFHSQCNLALAKFKACEYGEAYQAYTDACEWFTVNDAQKGQVLTALAFLYYKFNKIDDVKTHLFQSVNISPSIESRLALASLGLLEGDPVLTDAALTDLLPLEDDKEYVHHVAFLKATRAMLQGSFHEAKLILIRAIHRHPHNSFLWRSLSRILISYPPEERSLSRNSSSKVASAANCTVSAAIVLSQAEKNQKYVRQDVILRAFSRLKSVVSDCQNTCSNSRRRQGRIDNTRGFPELGLQAKRKALIEAQRAVLMSPSSPETWAMLFSASQFNSMECKLPEKWILQTSNASLRSWFEKVCA